MSASTVVQVPKNYDQICDCHISKPYWNKLGKKYPIEWGFRRQILSSKLGEIIIWVCAACASIEATPDEIKAMREITNQKENR